MLGTSTTLLNGTLRKASRERTGALPWTEHFSGSVFMKEKKEKALMESLRIAWKCVERTVVLPKRIGRIKRIRGATWHLGHRDTRKINDFHSGAQTATPSRPNSIYPVLRTMGSPPGPICLNHSKNLIRYIVRGDFRSSGLPLALAPSWVDVRDVAPAHTEVALRFNHS